MYIWKLILSIPPFLTLVLISVMTVLHLQHIIKDEKVMDLTLLFSAEFIMLTSAACLLVFLFRKEERTELKYWALLDIAIFLIAGVIGVWQFF